MPLYPLNEMLGQPLAASPLPPPPGAEAAPDFNSPDYRDVGDVDAMRAAIFDTVQRQAANLEPVSNSRYTLSLSDVKYTGPDNVTKAQHKKALLKNDYLTRKLWGTWTLSDTVTGKPLASRATVVAHVPYLTPLGTFTKGGNDYTLAHQMRLKPGVYTRWQDNGELEAHVNVEGGMGHRVYLEPETGVFKMKFGQANLPAADVLSALGATPDQLKEAWGENLYNTNAAKTDPKALQKLFQKVTNGNIKAENPEDKKAAIRDAFVRMKLDPKVSQYTLGQPYDAVNVESILATTKKLLAINAGKGETESRDDLTFQKVLGPEDIIAERFVKGKAALRQALWKAAKTGTLDKMPSGIFNKVIDGALISTGLGLPLEEINPLEVFDNQYRITRLGEGGISSLTAVPDSARDVHPSQLGFIDVIRSPESMKVGVDGRMAASVKKGKDGNIYTQLRDMEGNKVWKSAQDIADSVVAFPNALRSKNHFVPAVAHGKMQLVPRETVDYEVPYMQNTFHSMGNLIPMASSAKGQRLNMGTRFLSQALPLEKPEAPLVQCGIPDEDDKSYEELFGEKVGAIRSKENGVVISVTPDELVFKSETGEKKTIDLYNNMVFNRKTGMMQTPVVKPGDQIKAGQLLAKSNFTDDNGTTAVGCNARVAYLPFKGYNWEDAAVISESFAKRMSSTHYYKNKLAIEGGTVTGKEKFLALKPGKYTKTQLENFTDDGVIKPGTVVNTGDPLILAANKVEPTEAQLKAGKKSSFHDSSLTWEHHDPGVVTDVYASPKGMQVIVKTASQMRVADKLSNRYGTKCIVGAVVPDAELPSLPDGSKPEVLLSSLAIVGRVNPAQTAEAMLGRVAAKTGKRYAIKDFDDKDYVEFAKEELKKAGLNETEDLIDDTNPDYPKVIPHVAVGNSFIMKLQHTVESKAQSRGIGGYSMDQQPAKGGDEGAKRMGIMELNALLGHGATENINDMRFIKGQQNLDYWRQYMSGYTPPTPKVPYVYDRFVNYLKGSGINVLRDGPRLNIMAMTGKDVDAICGGRELKGVLDKRTGLQTLSTVAWDSNMKTVKGGLFDDDVTGGHGGNKWSYIKLADKLPNPVMELPLRLMLGYTENEFRDIMAGKKETAHGTGPKAIYEAAKTLDIDTEINKARMAIDSGRKTYRDAAIKRLGYLKNAKRLQQTPADWFTDKVPVLPPVFRPVAQLGDNKLPLVADPNYLYKDLFDANQTYQANKKAFGDKESGDLGLYVYDNYKAVTGIGDPVATESKTRQVRGLLKAVFSDAGPKYNVMQRQLLGMPVDFSGRSVIAPDPNLDMDSVGIPENIAWDAYKPFIIRRLRQYGRSGMQAIDEVKNKTKAAKEALQTEMESRPILINRAPTLHKFGFMAFNPKLMAGDHIHVNPFVCGGFGADFDGDSLITYTNILCEHNIVQALYGDSSVSMRDFEISGITPPSFNQVLVTTKEDNMTIQKNVIVTGIEMDIADVPVIEGSKRETKPGRTVWDVPEGCFIHALNKETMKIEVCPITQKHLHENLTMYDVTLGSKITRVLTVNEDDTLLAFKSGKVEIVKASEAAGLCVPRASQDYGTVTQNVGINRYISLGNRVPLNKEVASLIGALIGDGWVDCRNNVFIASGYRELLDCYSAIADTCEIPQNTLTLEHTYKTERWGSDESTKLYFHFTKDAAKALKAKIGEGAINKRIPHELLQGSRAVLIGVLTGLMDTDGTVSFAAPSKGKKSPAKLIKYDTISPALRDGFVSLCTRLGIRASVTTYTGTTSGCTAYNINMSLADMVKFCRENPSFKLNCKHKQEALEKIIESYDETNNNAQAMDVVPYPHHLTAALSTLNIRASEHTAYRKRGWIPRLLAFKLSKELLEKDWSAFTPSTKLPPAYRTVPAEFNWKCEIEAWDALIHNTAIQWEPVIKVERSAATTGWDLTVPDTYTFLTSQGIAVQDCVQFHVPTTKEAMEEAREKMLPSRNLLTSGSFKNEGDITKENLIGLYEATRKLKDDKRPVRTFASKADVVKAYKEGRIGPTDRVNIVE